MKGKIFETILDKGEVLVDKLGVMIVPDVVEDPGYRAAGVVVIEADEADVDPLKSDTLIGEDTHVSLDSIRFRLGWAALEANPSEKRDVIDSFARQWDSGFLDQDLEAIKAGSDKRADTVS